MRSSVPTRAQWRSAPESGDGVVTEVLAAGAEDAAAGGAGLLGRRAAVGLAARAVLEVAVALAAAAARPAGGDAVAFDAGAATVPAAWRGAGGDRVVAVAGHWILYP